MAVQYIFDTVIKELIADRHKRFSYAETGFLKRYLEDHGPEQLEKLKYLISESGKFFYITKTKFFVE